MRAKEPVDRKQVVRADHLERLQINDRADLSYGSAAPVPPQEVSGKIAFEETNPFPFVPFLLPLTSTIPEMNESMTLPDLLPVSIVHLVHFFLPFLPSSIPWCSSFLYLPPRTGQGFW